MKRFYYPVLITLIVNFFANADLMYYTFDGEVIYSSVGNISTGTMVTYVFGVDFDAQGFYDYKNASKPDSVFIDYTKDIYNLGRTIDYVYVDFIGGQLLQDLNLLDTFEYNFGASIDFFDNSQIPDRNFIIGGEQYNSIQVYSSLNSINAWEVGNVFTGYEQTLNASTNAYSWLFSDLALVSISPHHSKDVPEPSVFNFVLIGLVGFCWYRFTHKKM